MPYSKSSARMREYNRAYYLANKDYLLGQSAVWQRTHKSRRHQHYLNAIAKLKADGLVALGSVCACCGFDDARFLTMDHIHPIKGLRRQNDTWAAAKRSGWDKAQFQVLCANCNFAKSDNGQCPHQVPEMQVLALRRT